MNARGCTGDATDEDARVTVMNTRDSASLMGSVLIVDDEQNTLQSFARMLQSEGFTAFTADNAEDGLRQAARHHPDVILLDLRMPLVDGLAFLQRLRAGEAPRQTPVAIVTGDYFVEDRLGADLRTLGAEIHYKPLWLEDLTALAKRLLVMRID